MSKIKKVAETKLLNYVTTYKSKKEFFEVESVVYSGLEQINDIKYVEVFDAEVQDIDFNFYIAGKRVSNTGFVEIYEKLYGKRSYSKMTSELWDEICEHYLNNLSVKTLKSLTKNQLKNAFNELLESSCKNTWCEMKYADNYHLLKAAKLLHLDWCIHKRTIPYAHGKSSERISHEIINLNELQDE